MGSGGAEGLLHELIELVHNRDELLRQRELIERKIADIDRLILARKSVPAESREEHESQERPGGPQAGGTMGDKIVRALREWPTADILQLTSWMYGGKRDSDSRARMRANLSNLVREERLRVHGPRNQRRWEVNEAHPLNVVLLKPVVSSEKAEKNDLLRLAEMNGGNSRH